MPLVTSSGHTACAVASATPASRTRLAVLCHQGGGAASSSTPDGSSPPVHPCQGAALPGMRTPHGVRGAAQAPTGSPVASSLSLRPRLAPAPSAHTPRVLPGKIPSLPDSRLTVKPPERSPSDSSSPRGPAGALGCFHLRPPRRLAILPDPSLPVKDCSLSVAGFPGPRRSLPAGASPHVLRAAALSLRPPPSVLQGRFVTERHKHSSVACPAVVATRCRSLQQAFGHARECGRFFLRGRVTRS